MGNDRENEYKKYGIDVSELDRILAQYSAAGSGSTAKPEPAREPQPEPVHEPQPEPEFKVEPQPEPVHEPQPEFKFEPESKPEPKETVKPQNVRDRLSMIKEDSIHPTRNIIREERESEVPRTAVRTKFDEEPKISVGGGSEKPASTRVRVDRAKLLRERAQLERRQAMEMDDSDIIEAERREQEKQEKQERHERPAKQKWHERPAKSERHERSAKPEKISEAGSSNRKRESVSEKNWFGRNWAWVIAMGITAVFMLAAMIIGGVAPFGGRSFTMVDSMHQYVPFFSIYQEKLKSFGSMAYTWNVGGGQNFQSLLLYYMASPLNLIIILFSRNAITAAMSIIIAIKIILSAGSFSFFLSRRKGKATCNMIITGLGVAYALNNYMAGYFWNIMWLDCIMVFPLIILGFERLMKERDYRLYVLALFYSLFCNYYISFMICIFLVLWFFASRHGDPYDLSTRNYIKSFIGDGLRFAGASLLAAGMACLSLVMAYLAITKTASAHLSFPGFETYQSFFDVIKAQFIFTKPLTNLTFDGGVNIYCGIFAIVLLFLYLVSDRIDFAEKIRKTVLLLFIFISFNNKFLNYIWHGFHDQYGIPNRFAFLFIFTLLVIGYDAVIRVKKLSLAQVIIAGFCSLVLLFFTYYQVDITAIFSKKIVLLVTMLLIIAYTGILSVRNRVHNIYRITTIIIGVLMVLEILVNAGVGMAKNGFADGEYHIQYGDITREAKENVDKYAADKGYKFYREEMADYIMLDENSYNNMRSIGTFCSTVRGDMVTTMGAMGYYTGANEYLYKGATPLTDDLMGVRYIYSRGDDFYPAGENLPVVYDGGAIKVYENENAFPIAYQVNDDVREWVAKGPAVQDTLNSFAWLACNNREIFKKEIPEYTVAGQGCSVGIDSGDPDVISYEASGNDGVTIYVDYKATESGRYFMNIRGNGMEKVVYSVNGEEKSRDRSYIQMFDMGNIEKDDFISFEIIFSKDCSSSGTIRMYLSALDEGALADFEKEIASSPFEVQEFKDAYVKGNINIAPGKMLMTSIPYDEGWRVYDNGKEAEVTKVGDAFIALQLEPGSHELEFKFTPDGFKIGLIVSILSWAAFFALYIVKKKIDR